MRYIVATIVLLSLGTTVAASLIDDLVNVVTSLTSLLGDLTNPFVCAS